MKLTKKEAKRLSILKWEFIVNNGGDFGEKSELPKELHKLHAQCGYCEKYTILSPHCIYRCGKCPLILSAGSLDLYGCRQMNHPFDNWADNKTLVTAQAVLDLIRKS